MNYKVLTLSLMCAFYSVASYAAPSTPVHGRILNIKEIQFLNTNSGTGGQKRTATITTPMMMNGVITQDIGAIILDNESIIGREGIFPPGAPAIGRIDTIGYEVTVREYSQAVNAIREWCNYGAPSQDTINQCIANKNCHTVLQPIACNAHLIAYQNYLSQDQFAPNLINGTASYQICTTTGGSNGGGGSDNRCFIAGTKITMSDGVTLKNIEDIIIGDEVLVYQLATNTFVPSKVKNLFNGEKSHFITLNDEITSTDDHPYLSAEHIWKSANLIETQKLHPEVQSFLQIGDIIKGYKSDKYIQTIEKEIKTQNVYTFEVEHPDHNYVANGYVVHNKREGRD